MTKKNLLQVCILLFSLTAFSQADQKEGITMEQTIEFLNNKLGKNYKLELARKNMQLVINFYKNSVLFKIDRVFIETLDTSKIYFSDEEKLMVLRCRDAEEMTGNLKKYRDGCVEREILDKNIIGAYGRTQLDVGTDKKKIEGIQKAFVHLVRLAQDEEYRSSTPFE